MEVYLRRYHAPVWSIVTTEEHQALNILEVERSTWDREETEYRRLEEDTQRKMQEMGRRSAGGGGF